MRVAAAAVMCVRARACVCRFYTNTPSCRSIFLCTQVPLMEAVQLRVGVGDDGAQDYRGGRLPGEHSLCAWRTHLQCVSVARSRAFSPSRCLLRPWPSTATASPSPPRTAAERPVTRAPSTNGCSTITGEFCLVAI